MNVKIIAYLSVGIVLGASGCVSPQQRADSQRRIDETIPVCKTAKQCEVAWGAARDWVASNCGMKIQTFSDSYISTYNSIDNSPRTSCSVSKRPIAGSTNQILISISCANAFGCVPDSFSSVLAFNSFVAQRSAPFEPIKIGVDTQIVGVDGLPVSVLSESSGAKIVNIVPNGRAAKAGILVGDVLTKIGPKKIRSAFDISDALVDTAVGDSLPFDVLRSGSHMVIMVNF